MAYTPNATELIKITLPSGGTYDIVDARARELIEALGSPTHFLGESATEITDGAEISSITIKGKEGKVISSDPLQGKYRVLIDNEVIEVDKNDSKK